MTGETLDIDVADVNLGIRNEPIELTGDIVTITGPPDSGKTNLARYMLQLPEYARHLVYDPLFGFDPEVYNVIRPPKLAYKYRRYEEGNPELNKATDRFVLGPEPEKRPAYFAIDEAPRLLPNHKDAGPAVGELSDYNAHIDLGRGEQGIGVWLMGQRFAAMNSHFENKATHNFVMGYKGKNDRETLKEIHPAAPKVLDAVKQVDRFGFIYVGKNNTLRAFTRVEEVGEKAGI